MIARSTGEKVFNVFNIAVLAVLAVVSLYPFLYTISISFCTRAEADREGLHLAPGDVVHVGRGMVDVVGLGSGSRLRGPDDILDWQSFLKRLSTPAAEGKPTANSHILGRLSPELREWVRQYPTLRKAQAEDRLLRLRRGMIDELNGLLEQPGFFDRAAWANVPLEPEELERISRVEVDGEDVADVVFVNRERLNAAYPGLIAPHLRGGEYFEEYAKGLSPASYMMVFRNPEILRAYVVTIGRTVLGTLLTLVATAIAAYPLSRSNMPHRRSLTFFILFTMIFSGGMVPMYMVIKSIGLIDNFLVYVIPGMMAAFNIIIMKNFFQSIPESLAESARIDGANEFSILWRIYVPLSKPVLATVALWTAVAHWNMWFDGMLYVYNNKIQILQMLLRRIVIENTTELIEKGLVNPDQMTFTPETIKAATVIVTILPILFVYPFVQKYFVKGIMLGSIKE